MPLAREKEVAKFHPQLLPFLSAPKRSLSSHASTLEGSKRDSVPFPFWFLKQRAYSACCLSLTRKAVNSSSTPGREGFCSCTKSQACLTVPLFFHKSYRGQHFLFLFHREDI